ncbi:MAG: carbohydrate ABC transporter permease [Bacteroidaceae bacterium]
MNRQKGKSGQIYSLKSKVVRGIVSTILILYTGITLFVLGFTVLNSFKQKSELVTNLFGWPNKFVLDSYKTVFADGSIFRNFGNSLLLTLCGTALCVFLASMVAYGISRYDFKGKGALTAYFLIGMMVPMQVTVLPLFLIFQKLHLLNTLTGMILLYGSGISLSMFIFSRFFKTISKALEESAKLDGANDFTIYTRIILPVCKPVIFTVSLIVSVGYWNDFYLPMILLSKKAKYTLTLVIFNYLGQFVKRMDVSFAAVVITLVPVILLYCFFSNQMVEGITGGAVKG